MEGVNNFKGINCKFFQFLSMLILLLALSGCASIIKGELQPVNIKSNPSDAKVTIHDMRNGNEIVSGKTPQLITLKRGQGYFKKGIYKGIIEKEGYDPREFLIEGNPNGWYLGGNLIFGGLIGYLIVDPLTGSMWELDPDNITMTLREKGSLDPANFTLTEFKKPFAVENLCRAINVDSYDLTFKAPDNTIDRLNELLETPDLYDKINQKNKLPQKENEVNLSKETKDLLAQTADYRSSYKKFISLTDDQQSKIRRLNRRLLEECYAQETPKMN